MAACANSDDCIAFFQSLEQMTVPVNAQIWQTAESLLSQFWAVAEIESEVKLLENPGVSAESEPPNQSV